MIVFLVDDDEDDQEFFSMVLEEHFPSVRCAFANDGGKAIEKLKSDSAFTPQLILIDINMPRVNGIELLSEIKKIQRFQNSYIYMYSTSADPSVVQQCMRLGAAGFIKKESTEEALQKRLSEIIQQFEFSQ